MLAEWRSKWIKVADKLNNVVIDDFDYEHGIQGPVTKKHCVKCIAANQCWFLDEKDKKPETMNYSIEEIINATKDNLGLYHYNCHCKEINIPAPKESDIQLIIPKGKISWTFNNKADWIRTLGFEPDEIFLDSYKKKVIEKYCNGDYYIIAHNQYGVKINVIIEFEGKGEYLGRTFFTRTGWMVFSNGKLKNNTLLGGKEYEIFG